MKRIILVTVLIGSLFTPAGLWAYDSDRKMIMQPGAHFALAAAAQYTISSLCEKSLVRLGWVETPTWKSRYGCRFVTALAIIGVASYERQNSEGFQSRDFWADMAGVGAGVILLEW